MEITREGVLDALSNVIEPDLNKDIVSQNLVKNLEIEGNKIILTVAVVNPALHARRKLQQIINYTLKKAYSGQCEVVLSLEGMKQEERSEKRKVLPDVKNIIAIASGKGGVGKSTVTANLAGGLAKLGYKVGIVDADIYGPSMPTMFGLVGERPGTGEVNGQTKMLPVTSFGIQVMSIGFFTKATDAVVWRGPMASKALNQMFTETHWGEMDYLLVDLPPGTGDIHLSLVQKIPVDGAIIVSTPQEVALADARRGVAMFMMDGIKVPILGLIENMSWFTPEELPDNKYYIFGRDGVKNLAEGMEQRFLGQIPLVQSIRESSDIGRPAILQQNTIVSQAFEDISKKIIEITN
ncbi:MAG: Mrp/NBP35 family ATP-binding protein [Brumimicrobium sp.]